MAKKQLTLFGAIGTVFRNLSITVNLTVYAIYLVYLIYSIYKDVGNLYINIVLAALTGIFMIVYLILRLTADGHKKQVRAAKKYYKRLKLIGRAVISFTAVYSIFTAAKAVSPLALILAVIGAAFILLRLIIEFISFLIGRQVKKLTGSIKDRFARREDEESDGEIDRVPEDDAPKRIPKKKSKKADKASDKPEDIILDSDECVISDLD